MPKTHATPQTLTLLFNKQGHAILTEQYKAKPTLFNGTTYRSKAEARLAVCFDAWGWDYEYEPIIRSMPRFKPDFLIRHKNERIRVIEYKPCVPTDRYMEDLLRNFRTLLRNNMDKKDSIRCELWCVDFYEKISTRFRYSLDSSYRGIGCEQLGFDDLRKSFAPGSDFRFDLTNQSATKVDLSKIIPN